MQALLVRGDTKKLLVRKSEAEGNIIIPKGIVFLDNNQMSPSSVNNVSIDTKINMMPIHYVSKI